MNQTSHAVATTRPSRYARTIEVSKRIRWNIDKDVIRNRARFTRKNSCRMAFHL